MSGLVNSTKVGFHDLKADKRHGLFNCLTTQEEE